MGFSRANPSPRYAALQEQYGAMHEKGEGFLGIAPEDTFPGGSLLPQAARIKRLIDLTESVTILDYGSGKGRQYEPQVIDDGGGRQWPSIADYWDVEPVTCYDPCYPPFSRLPSGKFDGVISTDVLEHCPEEDIPWIAGEIFDYARRFVFANVACYPARKRLPTGENAHCTIKPVEWWKSVFERAASVHANLFWEVWIQSREDGPSGLQLIERKIGNV